LDFTGTYHSLILALADDTGASDSLLHVHAGLAVLLIARLVTRRSLATIVPFSIVCVAELANETMDALHVGEIRMPDTLFDVINTLFWPFMLMIGLRWRDARQPGGQST
jgi:hypothetical protein